MFSGPKNFSLILTIVKFLNWLYANFEDIPSSFHPDSTYSERIESQLLNDSGHELWYDL